MINSSQPLCCAFEMSVIEYGRADFAVLDWVPQIRHVKLDYDIPKRLRGPLHRWSCIAWRR